MTKCDPILAGKRLRKLRDCRTRAGVARRLGISVSALQGYEEGRRVPRDDMKARIADFYGVPVQNIFFTEE